jgi:uncharacterized protein
MTPQEAQMLQDLVRKVEQTQLSEKDPDAEALLANGFGRDPDALYKLAQTVLVQNLALGQARVQMDQLREQAATAGHVPTAPLTPAPARATTFLGSLFGHHEPAAAPPPPAAPPQYPQAPRQYQTSPQYQAPPYPADPYPGAPYAAGPAGGGGGSFLRSAATTAAGVAAGALAFQGIESLMHGFGGGGGGLGGPVTGAERPVEETVVNNYYDNPSDLSGEHHEKEAAYDDPQSQGLPDTSDTSSDDAQLEDASYDPGSDGSSDDDDQQLDDSSDDGSNDTDLV